ncbi:SixA phosphatase family protein [Plantactinospora sp. CA-290183]|uniref:SixA phosphatase family protein n=1 Tax=Plantactinospora sp. CA-290183 TaxID=3240006 RepID=UPI003D8F4B81
MTETSGAGPTGAGWPVDPSHRTLVLLRHAKAERPTSAADADRPLTARGHADAAAAGAWLAHGGFLPAVVICSPAKRTRQTWHDAALGMGAPPSRPVGGTGGSPAAVPQVRYDRRVYQGHPGDLLDLIRATDPDARTVLLIGHNPTISELSTLLDPVHADPEGLRTSGMVIHRIDGDWADVSAKSGPIVKWHTARG